MQWKRDAENCMGIARKRNDLPRICKDRYGTENLREDEQWKGAAGNRNGIAEQRIAWEWHSEEKR